MTVLSVDLASKFSAACTVAESGQVDWEANSHDHSSLGWVYQLGKAAGQQQPDLILVEDVPYGISNQSMVKPVLRLQGMLIAELAMQNVLERTLFVNPAAWQRHYPGVARAPKGLSTNESKKFREEAARVAAQELGYEPPQLAEEYKLRRMAEDRRPLAKDIKVFEKQETDHIDAYLMARWAYTHKPLGGIRAVSGVQEIYT